jgi:hypothetical protein
MYDKLLQMSGQKCYTLTADNEAVMSVDDDGVTITYLSGIDFSYRVLWLKWP